jgi:hypothetical protein
LLSAVLGAVVLLKHHIPPPCWTRFVSNQVIGYSQKKSQFASA